MVFVEKDISRDKRKWCGRSKSGYDGKHQLCTVKVIVGRA